MCLSEFNGDKNHQHHMEHVIICTESLTQSPLSDPDRFLMNWELKGGVTTKTWAIINNGGGGDIGNKNNYRKKINTVNTAYIVCIFSNWNYI